MARTGWEDGFILAGRTLKCCPFFQSVANEATYKNLAASLGGSTVHDGFYDFGSDRVKPFVDQFYVLWYGAIPLRLGDNNCVILPVEAEH